MKEEFKYDFLMPFVARPIYVSPTFVPTYVLQIKNLEEEQSFRIEENSFFCSLLAEATAAVSTGWGQSETLATGPTGSG